MTENDLVQGFMTELRRGSLTLAVLGSLTVPRYGYALLGEMQKAGIDIEANTLYPLLRRLERQGLLSSDWDTNQSRPRKYYRLNEKGARIYDGLLQEWGKLRKSIDLLLKGGTGDVGSD